jgi:putative methyltransferase (TIGR04325 family)
LIAMNLALSEARRPSDYPALFWLQTIAAQTKLRVVDFGGGAGQSYYQYRSLLGDAAIERWLVIDLPEVLEYGKRTAAARGASTVLAFERAAPADFRANVLFAAGSLHYWQEPLAALAAITGQLPPHILINRSPLRERGHTFVTIQRAGGAPVPCIVRSVDELTRDLNALGYALCDSWALPEKSLRFSLLPEYDASYRGAYFRRRADD